MSELSEDGYNIAGKYHKAFEFIRVSDNDKKNNSYLIDEKSTNADTISLEFYLTNEGEIILPSLIKLYGNGKMKPINYAFLFKCNSNFTNIVFIK